MLEIMGMMLAKKKTNPTYHMFLHTLKKLWLSLLLELYYMIVSTLPGSVCGSVIKCNLAKSQLLRLVLHKFKLILVCEEKTFVRCCIPVFDVAL